ncbi:MAG: hypothetical protein R2867_12865 [Caldilineaceae bacterium]
MYPNTNAAAWQALWQGFGVALPDSQWFEDLQRHYREPNRAYHTLVHIDDSLQLFAQLAHLASQPAIVRAALWFHDVFYDSTRSDNEEASAQWAAEIMHAAGVPLSTVSRVQELILYTQHSQTPPAGDGALLVDIDLAILGAATVRFDEYESQIRAEYAWVPWLTFCRRRAALLQQFLARPTIYQTDYFQHHFEERARQNLARSIRHLETLVL